MFAVLPHLKFLFRFVKNTVPAVRLETELTYKADLNLIGTVMVDTRGNIIIF